MLRRRSAFVKTVWKTAWSWNRKKANHGTTLIDTLLVTVVSE